MSSPQASRHSSRILQQAIAEIAAPTLNTIQGSKWNDLNGNGVQDGELGLAGWTIYLDQNQNGLLDSGETFAVTDANGDYSFTDLNPGIYTVAEVLQPGWEQTFPAATEGAQRLFALDPGSNLIVELNLTTGAVGNSLATPELANGGPDALAFSGGALFYASGAAFGGGNILYELDPNTGAVIDADPFAAVGLTDGVNGLAILNGLVVAQDTLTGVISFIDPVGDTVVRRVTIPGLVGGELAGAQSRGTLFTHDFPSNSIYEIDPATGAILNGLTLTSPLFGLAVVGDSLVLGDSSGVVSQFDLDTGEVVNTFTTDVPFTALGGDAVAVQLGTYTVELGEGAVVTGIDFGNRVSSGGATQLVFLDFVSDQNAGEYVYSEAEQNAILQTIAEDYQAFNYAFTLTSPTTGAFSTLVFNAGDPGGLAETIDFRNLNRSDSAVININGLLGEPDTPALTSENVIALSSTIGAHELGHLAGLRHGDSYGPIGSGIHNPPPTEGYIPVYPGPVDADETTGHLMASGASVGQSLEEAVGDLFFGEREALKLAFNEAGVVVAEQVGDHNSIATAQAIALSRLGVPNTLRAGDNAGEGFQVDAIAVQGALSEEDETDFYAFAGAAGELYNFAAISGSLTRLTDPVDPQISIFDATGELVPYYSGTAFNDNEFESDEAIIIDLVLPETGTYFVGIDAFALSDVGGYELLAYQFETVIEMWEI